MTTELASLYTAADVLVHPFRGEGFGMPITEAMSSGIPVIVPGYGAAVDFVSNSTGWLVDAKEQQLEQSSAGDTVQSVPLTGNAFVGLVDLGALRRAMREAFEEPELRRAKGRAARADVALNWSWDAAADKVERELKKLSI